MIDGRRLDQDQVWLQLVSSLDEDFFGFTVGSHDHRDAWLDNACLVTRYFIERRAQQCLVVVANWSNNTDLGCYEIRCIVSASNSCFNNSHFYFLRPEVKRGDEECSFKLVKLDSALRLHKGELHLVWEINQVFLRYHLPIDLGWFHPLTLILSRNDEIWGLVKRPVL